MSAPYAERPLLKEPVWIWTVPVYFHAGGAAGAALVLGAAAQLRDRQGLASLVRRCRRLAAGGLAAGTVLLIADLGRPERFLNMLRVFRPTSPLSVGSWVLATAAPLATGAAVMSNGSGASRRAGDAAGLAAGLLGLPLAGYTAVLVSQTAVPVWNRAAGILPALFVSSAASGAASALSLLDLDEREAAVVRRFGIVAMSAELAVTTAVERDLDEVERVGRPLREGFAGALWRAARALTTASLALTVLPRPGAGRRRLAGALGTAAGLSLRFAVFHAGRASSRDREALFDSQRASSPEHA